MLDLSRVITDEPPCSFASADRPPTASFTEGDAHGLFFVTSRLDAASTLGTHISFPGRLSRAGENHHRMIGEYPLDRFVGPALVVDVSDRLAELEPFFDPSGFLAIDVHDADAVMTLLESLDTAAITADDLARRAAAAGVTLNSVRGLLLRSGGAAYWRQESLESWQHLYFFNPFLSEDACDLITGSGVSFVGIDAFQLEHPIVNFRADEMPVVLHQECREYVADKTADIATFSNHELLLTEDVLVYENLVLPAELAGRVEKFAGVPLNFQLPGVTDHALARPYVVLAAERPD